MVEILSTASTIIINIISNIITKTTKFLPKPMIRFIKFILPCGAIRYIAYLTLKPDMINFFKKFANEQTFVIYPAADLDRLKHGTQAHDFEGIMKLMKFFHNELSANLDVAKSDTLSPLEKENNLICIGGPIPNEVTRRMLKLEELHYMFNDHMIIDKKTKNDICGFPSNSLKKVLPEKDHGIITRMKNPYEPKKDLIILCGCLGWGTKACIDAILDDDNLKILNQNEYFQIICACDIDSKGKAHRIRLETNTLRPIIYGKA